VFKICVQNSSMCYKITNFHSWIAIKNDLKYNCSHTFNMLCEVRKLNLLPNNSKEKDYPNWENVTETNVMVKCNDCSKKTTDIKHSLTTNSQHLARG